MIGRSDRRPKREQDADRKRCGDADAGDDERDKQTAPELGRHALETKHAAAHQHIGDDGKGDQQVEREPELAGYARDHQRHQSGEREHVREIDAPAFGIGIAAVHEQPHLVPDERPAGARAIDLAGCAIAAGKDGAEDRPVEKGFEDPGSEYRSRSKSARCCHTSRTGCRASSARGLQRNVFGLERIGVIARRSPCGR